MTGQFIFGRSTRIFFRLLFLGPPALLLGKSSSDYVTRELAFAEGTSKFSDSDFFFFDGPHWFLFDIIAYLMILLTLSNWRRLRLTTLDSFMPRFFALLCWKIIFLI
jgi:hypothetical protein